MGAYVHLLIIRKADGCVIKDSWIGQKYFLEKASKVLNQASKPIDRHGLSYRRGSSQEIEKINAEGGNGNITPGQMREIVKKYPDSDFVWGILINW